MLSNLSETGLMHDCMTKVLEYVRAWCKGQHQQGRGKVNLKVYPVEGKGLGYIVKSKADLADYVRSYNMLAGDSNTSINKFSYIKRNSPEFKKDFQDSLALFYRTDPEESDSGEQIWDPVVLVLIHKELAFVSAVDDEAAEAFLQGLLLEEVGEEE